MPVRRPAPGTEDWGALWIGLGLFALSLPVLAGIDTLGWAAATQVWSTLWAKPLW